LFIYSFKTRGPRDPLKASNPLSCYAVIRQSQFQDENSHTPVHDESRPLSRIFSAMSADKLKIRLKIRLLAQFFGWISADIFTADFVAEPNFATT